MKRILSFASLAAALLLLAAAPALAADIAVIVNKDNSNSVTANMVERIFKGEMTSWPVGGSIKAIDQSESSSIREDFSSRVVGMTVSKLKAAWAVKLFSGRATPPKVLNSDNDVIREVAGNKNAIGYVSASSVDSSVKVVLTK